MEDYKRIDDDSLFGVGIVVSDILKDQLFSEQKHIIMTPLKEGENVEYDGQLEEIRIICKNEGFSLALCKYYIPYNDIEKENYWKFDYDKIVLLRELKIEEDAPGIKESADLGTTFKQLATYLDIKLKELYFFFYFPEKIIINEDGKFEVKIENKSDWEHEH